MGALHRRHAAAACAVAALAFGLLAFAPLPDAPKRALLRVQHAQLVPSRGTFTELPGGTFHVEEPVFRAVGPRSTRVAALRFRYLGPSAETVPFNSGRIRRQAGIKLLAQDSCNVVYVMWRLEPAEGIAVEVKVNPDSNIHRECGTGGYALVLPTSTAPLDPALALAGTVLHAERHGRELRVFVDDRLVWEGTLPPEVLELHGATGVRTDNAVIDFELWIG